MRGEVVGTGNDDHDRTAWMERVAEVMARALIAATEETAERGQGEAGEDEGA